MKYLILSICLFWVGKPVLSQDIQSINPHDFIKNALFDGLSEDRFPVAIAQKILQNTSIFFVPKCPTCMPTQEAFNKYVHIKTKVKKTKTPKNILEGFTASDKTLQQMALRDLVERYIRKAYKKTKASKKSLEALRMALEKNRKTGMERKKDSFGNFCPSCEGTCAPQK